MVKNYINNKTSETFHRKRTATFKSSISGGEIEPILEDSLYYLIDLIEESKVKPRDPREVIKKYSKLLKIPKDDLKSNKTKGGLGLKRAKIYLVVYYLCEMNANWISKEFNRSKSTINNAIKTVEDKVLRDPFFYTSMKTEVKTLINETKL